VQPVESVGTQFDRASRALGSIETTEFRTPVLEEIERYRIRGSCCGGAGGGLPAMRRRRVE